MRWSAKGWSPLFFCPPARLFDLSPSIHGVSKSLCVQSGYLNLASTSIDEPTLLNLSFGAEKIFGASGFSVGKLKR
jgi:hypothetical protein